MGRKDESYDIRERKNVCKRTLQTSRFGHKQARRLGQDEGHSYSVKQKREEWLTFFASYKTQLGVKLWNQQDLLRNQESFHERRGNITLKTKKLESELRLELGWKVCTARICKQAVEETRDGWMLKMPFQILLSLLARVAKRAIELDDEELNKLMLRLTLYAVSNPESPEYDPEFVEAYLERGAKAFYHDVHRQS